MFRRRVPTVSKSPCYSADFNGDLEKNLQVYIRLRAEDESIVLLYQCRLMQVDGHGNERIRSGIFHPHVYFIPIASQASMSLYVYKHGPVVKALDSQADGRTFNNVIYLKPCIKYNKLHDIQ